MRGRDWAMRLAGIAGEAALLWQNGGADADWETVIKKAAVVRQAALQELLAVFDPDEPRRAAAQAICELARLPEKYRRLSRNVAAPTAQYLVAAHTAFPACMPALTPLFAAYRADRQSEAVYRAANALAHAADTYTRLLLAQR